MIETQPGTIKYLIDVPAVSEHLELHTDARGMALLKMFIEIDKKHKGGVVIKQEIEPGRLLQVYPIFVTR